METPITITPNGDGTVTAVFPEELQPAVEQALYYRRRDQRMRQRFRQLRKRMKADDAIELIRREENLSRSRVAGIVYDSEE